MFLMCLMTLSAVNAAENTTNMENMQSDSTQIKLGTQNNEILKSGGGTFSELNDEIQNSGNSLELSQNYTRLNGDDLPDGIEISKDNFVLDGKGYTIDANGGQTIFKIFSNNVTLKNICFVNVNSCEDGAIYCDGDFVDIKNCIFTNNNCTAINMLFGNITDCTFINNKGIDGGAIFVEDYCQIVDCNFVNNSASVYGGAIYFENTGYVLNSNFTNNKATDGGGAIRAYGECEIFSCNFVNNSADFAGAVLIGFGEILNSNFFNNNATDYGGALCCVIYDDFEFEPVFVVNCSFVNNSAVNGGAVYTYYGDFLNCSFVNNSAVNGSAILSYGVYLTIASSIFLNNDGYSVIFLDGDFEIVEICNNILLDNCVYEIYYKYQESLSGMPFKFDDGDYKDYADYLSDNYGNLNVNYNWFGHDSNNFNDSPKVYVVCNNWLFLNSTVNPSYLRIGDIVKLNFTFYEYNSRSNSTNKYVEDMIIGDHNYKFPVIYLDLIPINGTLNKNLVQINEEVQYEVTSLGINSITAYFANINYTVILNIPVSISADDIKIGEGSDEECQVKLVDENGKPIDNQLIKFEIDGKIYERPTDKDGIAKISLKDLKEGTYDLVISSDLTGSVTRKVTVFSRLVGGKNMVIDYLGGQYTLRTLDENGNPIAGETILMTINGVTYRVVTDKNGYGSLPIRLRPDSFTIVSKYKSSTIKNTIKVKYTLKSKSVVIKKSKGKVTFKAVLKWSNGKPIAGKRVTFKFKGILYHANTNKNGLAKVTLGKSVVNNLKVNKKYRLRVNYVDETLYFKIKVVNK